MQVSNIQLKVRFVNKTSVLCKPAFKGADVVVLNTQAPADSLITVSGDVWPVADTDKDGKIKTYEANGKTNYRVKLILRPTVPATTELAEHVAQAQAGVAPDEAGELHF